MESVSALHIHVKGVVQGVGFRPFVYALADRLHLKGWVLNTSSGVIIEVEGSPSALDQFLQNLVREAPPVPRMNTAGSKSVRAKQRQDMSWSLLTWQPVRLA
jgi:hydrogenase maturation protein HypF